MASLECLVLVSAPGTRKSLHDNPLVKSLKEHLDSHGIANEFVDNAMGWGCLNQDWLEFTVEVETSWGWCWLKCFSETEWEQWFKHFHHGRLLMQVYYKRDGELVAHH